MSTGLIEIMKRSALDAIENSNPTDLRFGKVVSVNPLKIEVTNVFTVPQSRLVVPEHLTNYTVDVEFDNATSSDGEQSTITGRKTITIYNGLRLNDQVALLRKQGGQLFYILDRI